MIWEHINNYKVLQIWTTDYYRFMIREPEFGDSFGAVINSCASHETDFYMAALVMYMFDPDKAYQFVMDVLNAKGTDPRGIARDVEYLSKFNFWNDKEKLFSKGVK